MRWKRSSISEAAMPNDPEQEFEVEITLVLKGYGKRKHVDKMLERVLHLLKYDQIDYRVKDTF